jgi:hypothetical protein
MEVLILLIGSILFIVISFITLASIITAIFYRLKLWWMDLSRYDDFYPD